MADKSPRQHQSKKAGKTLKEKRGEKKAKQAAQAHRIMTTPAQPADPAPGDQLVAMLRTIGDRDAAAGQLDNQTLGRCLGWTAAQTAESLGRGQGPAA